MTWLLLSLLACGEPPPIECEGLDEQACEEAEGCFPVEGWSIHGDYDCENPGPKEYAGCYTEEFACSDVVTYFHPPGAPDECWEFGDACAPDGWIKCNRNCWESE